MPPRKKSVSKKKNTSTAAAAAAAAESKQQQQDDAPPQKQEGAPPTPPTLTDKAVLQYLKEKGLTHAAIKLTEMLKTREGRQLSESEQQEIDEALEKDEKHSLLGRSTGMAGTYGYDLEGAEKVPLWGVPDARTNDDDDDADKPLMDQLGQQEARAYLDAFVELQLWVMTLPDDPSHLQPNVKPLSPPSITSILKRAAASEPQQQLPDAIQQTAESLSSSSQNDRIEPWMPPSTKPELLAISFALFTHTYCELLDVSMESTARTLLDTFQHIYEPLYPNELSDLKRCKTTEQMVRITTHNYQHHEAASTLRAVMVQSAQVQMKRDELARNTQHSEQAKRLKLEEYEKQLAMYNQKYEELSKKTSIYFERTKDFPFLRRGRTVKWQLTMSTQSYAMLSAFLSSRESLFPMSALLQAKCELSIERRDPLPYTPACVIPDEQRKRKTEPPLANVKWAAPVPPAVRLAEAGESVDSQSLKQTEEIPFPPLHLDEEYDTQRDAYKAKKAVEFNRALLTNGFRRLEAIERKHDYEVGLRSADDEKAPASTPILADALKPSILLQTLCSSESAGKVLGSAPSRFGSMDATAIWNEPGVNLTCAKMCPPDGRRIAAGCDDAAIRIWSMLDTQAKESAERPVKETGMVLLGHKNGFPVFDVSWNRDGRSLLSAGGDGTIRLWDTMVVGPYGTTKKVTHVASTAATDNVVKEGDGVMSVPGYRPESSAQVGGTALALYRGHAPSCPVWSVEFAPSGYYFASAGADASGRIWTTDRPAPVRVLQGHTSASVNTITWHPNCNYVLTGSDDRTVRMWDIHNGRCVRLLAGCGDGVNVVRVSPSGKYAAGADYSGIVHIWDLGTGRKVNELRPDPNAGSKRDATGFLRPSSSMIHSMSYSACGTALATGGDDCVVRIWDARGLGGIPEYAEGLGPVPLGPKERPGTKEPTKSFPTRRTSILDLQYTKRNLLLACGKFATAVPLVSPIGD